MKTKLTLTIDEALLPRAKRYARDRGVSLSSLIEGLLRDLTEASPSDSFVDRWRGKMKLVPRDEERFRALMDRYQ